MMRWSLPALFTLGDLLFTSPVSAQRAGACEGRERTVRRAAATTAFVGGNLALYQYFESAWWSGERSDFHFRHDWNENHREQDKFGHLMGGYMLTQAGALMLREACVSRRRAMLWSAAYATAFQLQIEVWDGLQAKYGFSPPDLIFNAAGAGFAVARELNPKVRAFQPTMSYWPTLANRRRKEFTGEPRFTVDYSGQTYWLAADVEALLSDEAKRYWPGILRLSVGHSITDYFPPPAFQSTRAEHKILLSLDLNPERLPGNHPLWKSTKWVLSHYRFPAPALQLTPKGKLIGWYR